MPQAIIAAAAATKAFLATTAFTIAANTAAATAVTYGTILKFTLLAASTIVSSSYARKQAKKAMRNTLNQGRTEMIRSPAAPREIVYGTVRKSGTLVFAHTTGTNNEFLHLIVALAGHEVNAIGDIYLNDEIVSLDGGGVATSAPYTGLVRVTKYLGTATQTADANLISEAPTVWTTDHRLRGTAYVYVRLKFNQDAFPGGIPNISAIIQGKKVLDTRTSTTAFSSNWALCLRDYMADTKLGLGVAAGEFDTTALNAAANISDQTVNLNPTGTEARYTVNGVVITDATPGDVIEQMASAGAGFVGYIGGKWVIHAGAYRTPTITLDENDLRGSISVQTKVSRREIFNGVKGVFTSPINQWQPSDYPPVTNATYTTQDGGVRIWQDLELPFTTSGATAQRLSKIALERVRQQIVVQMPCKLTALRVQAGDNVMVTNTRLGWSSKVFEVQSFSFKPDQQGDGAVALGVDLVLRENASAVWDWNDGEETVIDPAPNTNLPNPFAVALPTSLTLLSDSTTISQQADGTIVPRIKVSWTAPSDEFVTSGGAIRIEYKTTATSTYIPWNIIRGDVTEEFISDVVSGTGYDVRIRGENGVRVTSAWVSGSVTAATKTSAPAIPSGLTATGTLESITLGWTANTETDFREYLIFRNTSNSIPGSPYARALTTEFIDTGVAASTTYYYWLKAVNRSGVESAATSSVNAQRAEQSGAGGFLLDVSGSGSGTANGTVYTALSGSLTGVNDLRRHEVVFVITCPFTSPEDVTFTTVTLKRGGSSIGSGGTGPIIAGGASATAAFTVNDVIPSGSQSYTVEIDGSSSGLTADFTWVAYLKIY
jgi:hypothetical protein